jgi:hypothetical protein
MKKRFLQLATLLAFSLGTVAAQDITVFNFDGISPTGISSWADTFTSFANPVVDGLNSSTNVGIYTHKGAWSEVKMNTDVDPRIYSSYEVKAYTPVAGRIQIACFDATGAQLDWYLVNTTAGTGWVKYTRNLVLGKRIKSVMVSFQRDFNPSATPENNVCYFDDFVFLKSTSTYLNAYVEPFKVTGTNDWDSWTGAPSTKAWSGGAAITTVLDSTVSIQNWNGTANNQNIKFMLGVAPAITISNIDVNGFDTLKVVVDTQWPMASGEVAAFNNINIDDSKKAPIFDVKVGTGDWIRQITSKPNANGSWGTQTFILKDNLGLAINNVSSINLRISRAEQISYFIDNLKIIGRAHVAGTPTDLNKSLLTNISVYPNPASDYIVAKGAKSVSIFTLEGKQVLSVQNQERIDISSLKYGVFVVKINNGSQTTVSKLIKK